MSQERKCTIGVITPDQQLFFVIYDRSEVAKMAAELPLGETVDVEDEVDRAGDHIEMLVRQYMHTGDPEPVIPSLAASTFRLLSAEMKSEAFEIMDFMIVQHDAVSGDMMTEGFADIDEWNDAIESAMLDCSVRAELGLPIPRTTYQVGGKPTLH
jgi:hypothetical protein